MFGIQVKKGDLLEHSNVTASVQANHLLWSGYWTQVGQIKQSHCMKCIPVPFQSNWHPLRHKKSDVEKNCFLAKRFTCTRSMKGLAPALAATEYWAAFCVKATVVCTLPHTLNKMCTLPHTLKKSRTLWRKVAHCGEKLHTPCTLAHLHKMQTCTLTHLHNAPVHSPPINLPRIHFVASLQLFLA